MWRTVGLPSTENSPKGMVSPKQITSRVHNKIGANYSTSADVRAIPSDLSSQVLGWSGYQSDEPQRLALKQFPFEW